MRSISTREARANFADVIGSVYYTNDPVMVKKKDKVYAVIINPRQYEIYQKAAKEHLFAITKTLHSKNADVKEKDVLNDITKAVEAVRQEHAKET